MKRSFLRRSFFTVATVFFGIFLFNGISFGLQLTSSAFVNDGNIPKKYTADGENVSPSLNWSGVPDGTKNFALIVNDPDAPNGTFTHWVVYTISDNIRSLPEAITTKTYEGRNYRQGVNSYNKIGYSGPAPPRGPKHKYVFTIYALDTIVDLPYGANQDIILRVIKEHILAETELIGYYARPEPQY